MGYYQGDYYTGDSVRARFRGRLTVGDPGLFSRFSFKKLFRAAGKVASPLLKIAAPLIPGGQFVSGLLGGAGGIVKAARETVEPFMPLYGAIQDVRRGELPGTSMARAVAGGTPGLVAATTQGPPATRRRRVYRPRRRRRRY